VVSVGGGWAASRAGAAHHGPAGGLRVRWLVVALAALLGSAVLGLLVGPAPIPLRGAGLDALDRLPLVDVDSGLTQTQQAILWQLRLPRVVLGALVGGMLALGGAAYQGAFRNPLADPYLLGVAAGAGLGATLAIAYAPSLSLAGVSALPLLAFVGAAVAVALAFAIGRSARAGQSSTTLVLAGVAVAAFLTAAQTFVQQSRTDTLRQVYDWILGRLSVAGWGDVRLVLPYVLVCAAVIVLHGRLLEVLSLGDEGAEALGVRASRVRLVLIAAVTLGTAAVVAVSGLIGFVGIVVPHAIRLAGGTGFRTLLPLSFVVGAAFLILADLLARTALSPAELPIGVVTAAVGAPFFVIALRTSRVVL
jgi:iron complex transport system permease protein